MAGTKAADCEGAGIWLLFHSSPTRSLHLPSHAKWKVREALSSLLQKEETDTKSLDKIAQSFS